MSSAPQGVIPTSTGYQYINKQVNNVKLVNNNNLTLNVRNFNNRSGMSISNLQEDGTGQSLKIKPSSKGSTQPIPLGNNGVLKT